MTSHLIQNLRIHKYFVYLQEIKAIFLFYTTFAFSYQELRLIIEPLLKLFHVILQTQLMHQFNHSSHKRDITEEIWIFWTNKILCGIVLLVKVNQMHQKSWTLTLLSSALQMHVFRSFVLPLKYWKPSNSFILSFSSLYPALEPTHAHEHLCTQKSILNQQHYFTLMLGRLPSHIFTVTRHTEYYAKC